MTKKRIASMTILIPFVLALFSCAKAAAPSMIRNEALADKTMAPAPSASGFSGRGADEASGGASAVPSSEARMVIKTASVSVVVKDVDAAFGRAVQLAEQGGGYVQSSTRSVTGGEIASLTVKLPPDGFLSFIAAVEALGKTESKNISGQDVTEEYFDLEGELENLLQVRSRLFQLLSQAKKVEEAIQVEQELERVGADVNRIKGRMKYLQTMVGMSTVNLTLESEARPVSGDSINWSFIGNGFVVAARILVRILFFILQSLVVLIPLAAIGFGAAWAVIRIRRMRGKPGGKAPGKRSA